jgi:hypothetical protein
MKKFYSFLIEKLCFQERYQFLSPVQTIRFGDIIIVLLVEDDTFIFRNLNVKEIRDGVETKEEEVQGFII